jgi:hypothetical protein
MGRDWKAMSSYTLTSTEVEKMLSNAYGDKLHPVNNAQMARLRNNQAKREEKQARVQADADNQTPDVSTDPES